MFEEKSEIIKDLFEGITCVPENSMSEKDILKKQRSKALNEILRILQSTEKLSSEKAIELIDKFTLPYAEFKQDEKYEFFKKGFILGGKIAFEMLSQ